MSETLIKKGNIHAKKSMPDCYGPDSDDPVLHTAGSNGFNLWWFTHNCQTTPVGVNLFNTTHHIHLDKKNWYILRNSIEYK